MKIYAGVVTMWHNTEFYTLRLNKQLEEENLKNSTNFDNAEKYYMYIVDNLLQLKTKIKNDTYSIGTVESLKKVSDDKSYKAFIDHIVCIINDRTNQLN